jgi:hypothetical protein
MNHVNDLHVRAYQQLIGAEMRSSRRTARHGFPARVRWLLANTLVLAGARMMPDTPALVGGRVLVFEPATGSDPEDHGLQPAA